MSEKFLVVIDMQNDFVTGSLGSLEAQKIVPALLSKVQKFKGTVLFTQDTHNDDYLQTQEGKQLPVKHCILGTDGWQLIPELRSWQQAHDSKIYRKPSFGSIELAADMQSLQQSKDTIGSIELVGVCTDICVISNALLLKAYLPEVEIIVDSCCCAGVTPKQHKQALSVMQSCQIIVAEKAVE